MRRSVVRRGLLGVAAVGIIAFALIGTAQLPFVRGRLLDWLRAQGARDLGIVLQSDELRYSLISLSAELRNPSFSVPGERPFLTAGAVRIALARRVFLGKLELAGVELIEGRLAFVRHRDGRTNLPVTRTTASSPTPIHLGILSLRQLRLDLEDEAGGHRLRSGPIDLTLDTRTSDPRTGAFGPGPFALRIGATETSRAERSLAGTLGGRLGFDGARLSFPELRVDTPEARLAVNGWIDLVAETVSVEAQGRVHTDLARAGRLLGAVGASLAGSAAADIAIRGPISDSTVHVVVDGKRLRYRTSPEASLAAEATYAAGRLNIGRVDVTTAVGAAAASGTLVVTSAGPRDTSRMRGRVANVDLDRVLDAAGVTRPVDLGSVASGEIEITTDGTSLFSADWWRHLNADGSLVVSPSFDTAQDDSEPAEGSNHELAASKPVLAMEGRLDLGLRGDRWTVRHSLRSTRGGAVLDGVLEGQARERAHGEFDSTLSGQTRARVDDVRVLTSFLRQSGVALPAPIDEIGGSVDAVLSAGGTVASPRVVATIAGRRMRLRNLPEGELDAVVTFDERAAAASSMRAHLGTLGIAASGEYTWSGQIGARFEATADDVGALARLVDADSEPVTGSARLVGSVQGNVRSPDGRAQLTVRDLTARDVSIGSVDALLRLADERLQVDAEVPELRARLQSAVGIRDPFAFQAEATFDRSSIATLLPVSARSQVASDGTVSATVRGQGNVRRPLETTGELALRALDLKMSDVPVRLEAPAVIAIQPNVITASPVLLRVGEDSNVRLQGTLGLDDVRDGLDVRVEGPLTDLLHAAAPVLPGSPIEAESSRVNLQLHVGGTLRTPEPAGTLTLEAGALRYGRQPPLTGVALDARIEPTRIALQSLVATWQGAKLLAEGALPLRMIAPEPSTRTTTRGPAAWGSGWLASLPSEPRSATIAARVTGISTDALTPFVDPDKLQEIAGTVGATVTAEADGFEIDRVRGSVVLDQAAVTLAGVPFAQVVPTRVRLERGRADIEDLRWSAEGNELRVSGGADLTGSKPTLDLGIDGAVDMRILGAFTRGTGSGGIARPALTMKGPIAAPDIVGSIGVTGGELRVDVPSVAASDVEGTIAIGANRVATIALNGLVNGGTATVEGNINLEGLTVPTGQVNLTARNVTLEYPAGFQTESNADLALTLARSTSTLAGRVDVLSGLYREPLVVSRTLLAGLEGRPVSTDAASPFLANLGLDVTLSTSEDVRIDNNYGRLNLTAKLQITGTAAQPGAIGRVEAEPDGEIYLAGNTYRIRSLVIDLADSGRIAPEVSFLADTRVGSVPIEIALQCASTGPCERDVRSEAPDVTDAQAEALLFGISEDRAQAGAQLVRLLSGELLGLVGQTIRLDTLRLEQGTGRADLFDDPTLVAGDVNPASRLTFGKRLGERVEIAYSQNLAENGFTTSTSYFAPAGMSFRALLLDDESRSYEFRHQPRIGARRPGRPAPRRAAVAAAIRFSGSPGVSDNELRSQLRLTEGHRFEFAAWRADRERLMVFYQKRGFFEARVRARRLVSTPQPVASVSGGLAVEDLVLEYIVDRGRPTRLDISGFDVPSEIRQRIVDRWTNAIFDGFLERDAALIVREHLYKEGRLQATVTATVQRGAMDQVKTLAVAIDPGPETPPRLLFEGNTLVSTARLVDAAQRAGPLAAWLDPASFGQMIKRLYQGDSLLSAEVNVRAPEIQQDASVVRVVIREGEPWQIGRVSVSGAEALPDTGSADDLGLPAGGRYDPKAIAERVASLEQRFRDAGFLDVRVTTDTVLDAPARQVNVRVLVEPGLRSVLTALSVEGAAPDSAIIARSVGLTVGQPVGSAALSATRRRLYETGAYGGVEIDLQPAAAPASPGDRAQSGERRVVARIRVEERPRYTFRYGLALNDTIVGSDERDRQLGFAADLENRNVLGLGATVGVSARLRRDQKVGRVFVGTNRFFGLPIRSNVFFSRARQETGSTDVLTTDITQISAEQTYQLRRLVDVRYGYSLGRNRTTAEALDFDLAVRIARLTMSGLVDRRNDRFDPSRGWFTAANFELSRPGLGSELSFAKGFLQQFQFIPISHGIVVASAARVGLARTFREETLIPSERFFAGGATSVRGYADNSLGPRGIFDDAEGGSGLFIANGEIRFPIYKWLKGVGFVDVGNVYPTVGDLLRSRAQIGAGVGVRLNTPVGLLRLDLGVPLNPRPFDSGWTTHFGLGHAF